jgi:hypothetical protein
MGYLTTLNQVKFKKRKGKKGPASSRHGLTGRSNSVAICNPGKFTQIHAKYHFLDVTSLDNPQHQSTPQFT